MRLALAWPAATLPLFWQSPAAEAVNSSAEWSADPEAAQAAKLLKEIGSAYWIQEGAGPRIVYIFFDPNCPFSHKLYLATRAEVGKGGLQLRWIPVGQLEASSPGKAAAILAAPADETVDVPRTGGREVHPVARSYMAEILEARARELFEVLWREATTDIPPQELRAGLVLTGGGAALDGMTDEAEQVLGVPVRIGVPRGLGGLVDVINGPEWACVAGLLLVGRGGAASPKGRPSAPAGLLSKLKNSLGKMFTPASAI